MSFKKGDRVRVKPGDGTAYLREDNIVEGRVYIIAEMTTDGAVLLKGKEARYDADRFEHCCLRSAALVYLCDDCRSREVGPSRDVLSAEEKEVLALAKHWSSGRYPPEQTAVSKLLLDYREQLDAGKHVKLPNGSTIEFSDKTPVDRLESYNDGDPTGYKLAYQRRLEIESLKEQLENLDAQLLKALTDCGTLDAELQRVRRNEIRAMRFLRASADHDCQRPDCPGDSTCINAKKKV